MFLFTFIVLPALLLMIVGKLLQSPLVIFLILISLVMIGVK